MTDRVATLTDAYMHAVLGRDLGGTGWRLSNLLGTMAKTRLARRGTDAVAVKLVDTPPPVLTRLSDLGVTPQVLAMGTYDGSRYVIQRAVDGPNPDHAWFAANVGTWAELIGRYVNDAPLRELLAASPGFWRLTAPDAVAMVGDQPERTRFAALRDPSFRASVELWRRRADSIAAYPLRPIHPDPHWHNYVLADARPYLLDWEHIDLSDPIRDVGIQVWGFLRKPQWPEFLRTVGFTPSEELDDAIHWWAGLKMLMNALFIDGRGDEKGATFHANGFRTAVANQPWLP